MKATRNYYSARRWPDRPVGQRWQGWMTYADAPNTIVWSPVFAATKRDAINQVKAQHPERAA